MERNKWMLKTDRFPDSCLSDDSIFFASLILGVLCVPLAPGPRPSVFGVVSSTPGAAIRARVPVAASSADFLREGGNGLTDHLTE